MTTGKTIDLIYGGEATSSVVHPDGSKTETSEKLTGGHTPMRQLAEVDVRLGNTLNTGNYTSVRIDVGVRIPCEVNEIDAVCDYAVSWVDARVAALIESARAAYAPGQ